MNPLPVNTILHGEALSVLKTLPANYVQTVVTSPPYYGLRSYLPDGHPDKGLELGLEETPACYIERLVAVFREVKRVLRKDGTIWLNLGDSYSSGTKNTQVQPSGRVIHHTAMIKGKPMRAPVIEGIAPKQLLGIPWRVAFALQTDGWILRSEIIWHKPNAMPESVIDRPTKSHEYLFLLAKSERYYYDHTAILEPLQGGYTSLEEYSKRRNKKSHYSADNSDPKGGGYRGDGGLSRQTVPSNPAGRNKRSVWTITTTPYSKAHFATFPPKLIEPCILAGSRPGDIILDPFIGAGTTALVALQHSRRYVGVELNEEYIHLAEERISHVQQNLWTSVGETIA